MAGRTGGAWIGQFMGPAVGSLLFGPAGFLVFSGLGALVGSHLGRTVALGGLARLRSRALDGATKELALSTAAQVPRKIGLHRQRASEVASRLAGGSTVNEEVSHYPTRLNLQQRVQHVLRLIRRAVVHPSKLQAPLKRLGEALRPGL